MTDFLTRLVQRTLGTMPLVQPHLLPRFARTPSFVSEFQEMAEWTEASNEEAYLTPPVVMITPASIERVPRKPVVPAKPDDPPLSVSLAATPGPRETLPDLPAARIAPAATHPAVIVADVPPPSVPVAARIAPTANPPTVIAADVPPAITEATEFVDTLPEQVSNAIEPPQYEKEEANKGVSSPFPRRNVEVHVIMAGEIRGQLRGVAPQPERTFHGRSAETDKIHSSSRALKMRDVESAAFEEAAGASGTEQVPLSPNSISQKLANRQKDSATLALTTLPGLSETSREPASQPQPVIHVTIGRIEVRATPPPTLPQRPAHSGARPALSLENYLKQRSGGSR